MQRQGYLTIRGRLPSLIALIALVLLAAMGWLGWRMLAQNLVIEKQRRQEGMESAASILCRELLGKRLFRNPVRKRIQGFRPVRRSIGRI
jgi:hypothetical protein